MPWQLLVGYRGLSRRFRFRLGVEIGDVGKLPELAEKAAQEERRADFNAEAEERFARIAASGETVPWQEMRAYLEARLADKTVERPQARKLAR